MNNYQTLLEKYNILLEVKDHVQKGEVISAIKLVRNTTGLGLKESKELVEKLIENQFTNTYSNYDNYPVAETSPENNIEEQVRQLLHQNKKINAVKLVYETTGMKLKDSKDFVEKIEMKETIVGSEIANHGENKTLNHSAQNNGSKLFVESNSSGKWFLFLALFFIIMLLLYFFYY